MPRVCKKCQRVGIKSARKFSDEEGAGDDQSQLQAATGTAAIALGMMMPVMFHNNRSI